MLEAWRAWELRWKRHENKLEFGVDAGVVEER